jgi:hypothetical protein
LLIKLGAARKEVGPATWRIIDIQLPDKDQAVTPETFGFKLNWPKLREARRREGSYLLRSNVTGGDPAQLWAFYLQLVEVEQAFKELKGDLAIRPIYHQSDERIEAHIFVASLADCLQVTLKQRLRSLAPGLTPRSVLDKMAAIQMVDVQLPTTDGRTVMLSRSGTAIWHHPGRLVPIRYVLVRDVAGEFKPQAFLCTDLDANPLDVLRWFVRRWSIEVTFAEVRRHLGVETQRQWSDLPSRGPHPPYLACSL